MKTPSRAVIALSGIALAFALTTTTAQADDVIGTPTRSTVEGALPDPTAIVAYPNGTIYVSSPSAQIFPFTPDDETSAYTQGTAISGAFSLVGVPAGLSVDTSGSLWVADRSPDQILKFTGTSAGNVPPMLTISGSNTALNDPADVILNKSREIIVANNGDNKILVFAPGAGGNAAPSRTIVGPATGLDEPAGLALDSVGNIYVANYATDKVTVYAPNANGDALPIRTISGQFVQNPSKLAIDTSNNLYVTAGGGYAGAVQVFAPGTSGDSTPVRRLLTSPIAVANGLALDANRNIYVTFAFTSDSAQQFAPLMPFLKPSAARSLKVSGSSKSSTRTISWTAPLNNGGTPITKYKIVVKSGSKTLYSKTTTSRSFKVLRSKLKNGTNTVTITAYNKVGPAPSVKKSFSVKK